ncbi:sugar transferase [Pediococcus ethanolidurans]|uniref:Sugar transferase n=1 Tax=Pediococcus ethanolidurans TaxID=319653 RepID=A0A0R2K2M0_9LACO|nr:sugar transferase [Pediococcus ethanolidurans]KRN81477.1 sugar transferase [Pediococcus ethanolidurans]GEN95258.1 capsular polysaccharide biosynthesis protein [Pediococcus ethanolidurans]SER60976.1 Sugar transferase involved in LPS biosynthesis (colanic, teichoic acid) [Pediococcus ethanolidurans]
MEEHLEKNVNSITQENFVDKLNQPLQNSYLPVKRMFDVIFSFLLLIPGSLLILIFMMLLKLETPGKSFYRQKRVGIMGKTIMVTKLRSMYSDAESKSGAVWAKKNDSRITRVGHFMRRTRIDELPQLWSVIKGDMSLIGPRPERPNFTQQFSEEVEGFEQRLIVRPGLSGYAQVHGGYDDDPQKKLINDLYYIKHISFTTDLKIVFATVRVVLTGDGAR